MKTLFSLLLLLTVTFSQSFGVANAKIEHGAGVLMYYNWSQNTYPLSGHYITIGESLFAVAALTIAYGNMMVPAGDSIKFIGLTYKNSAVAPNSVALWFNNDTSNATNMVDFIQWGAAGQPFEAKAVAQGLWQANDFIPGEPDYVNNDPGNFTLPLSQHWTALDNNNPGTGITNTGLINEIDLTVTPNPFQDQIKVRVSGNSNFDVSVSLYNYNGAILDKLTGIRENEVPLAEGTNLPAGVYFIRVESLDGSFVTRKVLKY